MSNHTKRLRNKYQTLQSGNTLLQQELNSARQLNTQINETKNETQMSLNTISRQNRTQKSKIKDLEAIQKNLKQKVNHLQLKIKDLEEREQLYREAEKLYEPNFQDIADLSYATTQFLQKLRNSSFHKELNSKETQTTLDLKQILKRNSNQADLISALHKKKKSRLLNNQKIKISALGKGAGPGHGAGRNSSNDDDTRNKSGNQNQTVDTTILDKVVTVD